MGVLSGQRYSPIHGPGRARYSHSVEIAGLTAIQKYAEDGNKYKQQAADIQEKAREYEKERDKAGRKADYFHFGEVFLEVAIVFSSLAILSKRKALFTAGVIAALAGVVISATAYWVISGAA